MAFSTHDQVPDSPTNTFATLNPLIGSLTGTMSDGNLKYSSGAVHDGLRSNIYVSTGKWYFETILISQVSGLLIGISSIDENVYESGNLGNYEYKNTIRYYSGNGRLYYHTGSTSTNVAYGDSWTNGDVIGVYLNLEDNELFFYKNGTAQNSGTAINLNSSTYNLGTLNFTARFDEGSNVNTTASVFAVNFGQDHLFGGATLPSGAGSNTPDNGIGTFAFSVPTGAKALCTANLPDPAIDPAVDDLPENYFKCVAYTGDGNAAKTITTGLAADFVWIKNRDAAIAHILFDSVRGVSKVLQSNATGAEYTDSNTITDFGSSSFSVGSNDNAINQLGVRYIAWCWRAGGSPSGSNIYMKDGTGYTNSTSDKVTVFGNASNYTITPTSASIGTKQGFGIYLFTASTGNTKLPHGLGKAPELVILKSTNYNGTNWVVTFTALGHDLNLNGAVPRLNGSSAGAFFQTTADADAITFGLDSFNDSNKAGNTYIVYAFTSIEGYSKMGSYVGNGSPDGPYVACGFRPALILYKNADAAEYWHIHDNVRDPNNPISKDLYPNISSVEANYTDYPMDFLSNGFKLRSSNGAWNTSGDRHIYMAFAAMPFKYANAR